MRQLTSNVFVETEARGCDFGFVTTSDGIVLIDTPHKPSTAMQLKAEIEKRGQLRYIINTEPHGDHWTGNAFFDAPGDCPRGRQDPHPQHRHGRPRRQGGHLRAGRTGIA